jgi:hypothetical protein
VNPETFLNIRKNTQKIKIVANFAEKIIFLGVLSPEMVEAPSTTPT